MQNTKLTVDGLKFDSLVEINQRFGVSIDASDESETYKPIVTIYGARKFGKTTLALNLPKGVSILCLSFDGMSLIIKESLVKQGIIRNEDVRIVDIAKRVSVIANTLQQGSVAVDLAVAILSLAKGKYDVIVIDGAEMEQQFCEWKMRYNNVIPISGGVEWNFWKERNAYLSHIHDLAVEAAKYMVIYTTDEKVDEYEFDSDTTKKTKIPRWVEKIGWTTHILIQIVSERQVSKQTKSFYAIIDSDKGDLLFGTGKVFDVSNNKPLFGKEIMEKIKLIRGEVPTLDSFNKQLPSGVVIEEIPKQTPEPHKKSLIANIVKSALGPIGQTTLESPKEQSTVEPKPSVEESKPEKKKEIDEAMDMLSNL